MLSEILFWVLSALAIVGGIGMITSRNPIYSVLSIVVNFFCIGGLFLLLHSEFLAVIQIIVYAGAIMVLFLFVVMLLNLSVDDASETKFDLKRGLAFILGIGFVGEMVYALSYINKFPKPRDFDNFAWGKVEPIGKMLMTDYLFPFEMISVILLAALMGAIIIAKKHKSSELVTSDLTHVPTNR